MKRWKTSFVSLIAVVVVGISYGLTNLGHGFSAREQTSQIEAALGSISLPITRCSMTRYSSGLGRADQVSIIIGRTGVFDRSGGRFETKKRSRKASHPDGLR